MLNKPKREFKSIKEFEAGMQVIGKTLSPTKLKREYLKYLNWYRQEMRLYREKMDIVKIALTKLTQEEIRLLRLYFR